MRVEFFVFDRIFPRAHTNTHTKENRAKKVQRDLNLAKDKRLKRLAGITRKQREKTNTREIKKEYTENCIKKT